VEREFPLAEGVVDLQITLPTPPPPEPDGPVLEQNIARRVLASYDRIGDLAEAVEALMQSQPMMPGILVRLIIAAGNLREKQIYAGAELLGDVKTAMKSKKAVKEA